MQNTRMQKSLCFVLFRPVVSDTGSGRDKSGNGRTCFQRKLKRLGGCGGLPAVCPEPAAGLPVVCPAPAVSPAPAAGLPAVCPEPAAGLPAVCLVSPVCPAPVVLPVAVVCPAPVVLPVAVVCPEPVAVCPAPAVCLVSPVCPAPVVLPVAVVCPEPAAGLPDARTAAVVPAGNRRPSAKQKKITVQKKRMFQRNIRKNEERFSENITAISVLASEILVS